MADFPALEPLRREWEFPDFPTLDYEGVGGSTISFEYGDTPTDQPLTLVAVVAKGSHQPALHDLMRLFDGLLDILGIPVHTADNDHVLDAIGNE